MTFGNLHRRPDLSPLFGPLTAEENDRLLERLLAIDARIERLAEIASRHVGVPYEACRIDLSARDDGTSAGFHGGPSGSAGDIWFDVSPSSGGGAWTVESRIVVFCTDAPEPRGGANTHDLAFLQDEERSPSNLVGRLDAHLTEIESRLLEIPPHVFTRSLHSDLPPLRRAGDPAAGLGAFIDAVVQDQARARTMLRETPDLLQARYLHQETALHFLAVEGYSAGVDFLATAGAEVDATNAFGDTALVDAATLGLADVVAVLLRHGADPNAVSPSRDSVVHAAAGSRSIEVLDLVLRAGGRATGDASTGETVWDAIRGTDEERRAMEAVLDRHGIPRPKAAP